MAIIPRHEADFQKSLAKEFGSVQRETFHNNNSTVVVEDVNIIELKNLDDAAKIITKVYEHNQKNKEAPVTVVPVAGFTVKGGSTSFSPFSCFSADSREKRVDAELSQSFSLNPLASGGGNLYLRVSSQAQKINTFVKEGVTYEEVSAGVTIRKNDDMLHARNQAFPLDISTLHASSLVGGSATSSYGPNKEGGAMTSNIVKKEVVNHKGQVLTLSETENKKWFDLFRHCHLGTCFWVKNLTFKNIQEKFLMKRHTSLLKDAEDLRKRMMADNPYTSHLGTIIMYIPVDIEKEDNASPRIMLVTFDKAPQGSKKDKGCQNGKELSTYLKLEATDGLAEPLIDVITKSEKLRPCFPLVLKAAALETFGNKAEVDEIDYSASIVHLFSTYTDLPIADINWLIVTESPEQARDLVLGLTSLFETNLREYAKDKKYPAFNDFQRYLKGIYDPEGNTISPLAIDKPTQSILSFELLTYQPLAETPEFIALTRKVIAYLHEHKAYHRYHLGKTIPENLKAKDIYTSDLDKIRLGKFKAGVTEWYEGNLDQATFLTEEKKEFFDLGSSGKGKKIALVHPKVEPKLPTREQERVAAQALLKVAENLKSKELAALVKVKQEELK